MSSNEARHKKIEIMTKFKVEKNKKYGDFRVVMYVNGVWKDEFDGMWSEAKAKREALLYRERLKKQA
jgi:recombinational DNA repair protein RecT